jgi:hypothetical protein
VGLNTNLFVMDRQLMEVALSQIGERSSRDILAVMREEAEEIASNARKFAPVDEGYLQDSIEVVEERSGINGRTVVTVQVDPEAQDDRGMSVYDYGRLVSMLLEPHGSGLWKLGKKSRDKDGGRGVVGGRFIERAVKSRQAIIGRRINEIARRIFK